MYLSRPICLKFSQRISRLHSIQLATQLRLPSRGVAYLYVTIDFWFNLVTHSVMEFVLLQEEKL